MTIILQGEDEDLLLVEKMLKVANLDHLLLEVELVPVEPYGSEGLMPLKGCCPEYADGESSCISGSGGSLCGGFMGSEGEKLVYCNRIKKETK
jgi:hypothetical protein